METVTQAGAGQWLPRFSTPSWLDDHFEFARPEYTAALRAVEIAPGASVVDVGCGSGGFVPLLADAVGAGGSLTAIDIEADNLAVLEARHEGPADLHTICASALDLPLADASRDLAWCANVTTYLGDRELEKMLAELVRVVRAGGRVAIKEADASLFRIGWLPQASLRRLFAQAAPRTPLVAGLLRAPDLDRWLRRAGLVDVRRRSFVVERHAPFSATARRHLTGILTYFADLVRASEDPDPEWAALLDPARRAALLDAPDFSYTEGFVLVTGTQGHVG
jgi:ubiquinone/menaquinone biosynthesis C-methylase UbiE